MSCTSAYRSALSFAVPPCPVGAPGLAIVGVFVPRYETDSTFASTSLQQNETVIAFASDERPLLGHFDPAKVLSVSRGRAAWPAKVLLVSRGRAAWPAKVLLVSRGRAAWPAKVLLVSRGRAVCRAKVLVVSKLPSSRAMCEKVRPARPGMGVSAKKFALQAQNGRKMLFSGVLGEFFRGRATGSPMLGEFFRG